MIVYFQDSVPLFFLALFLFGEHAQSEAPPLKTTGSNTRGKGRGMEAIENLSPSSCNDFGASGMTDMCTSQGSPCFSFSFARFTNFNDEAEREQCEVLYYWYRAFFEQFFCTHQSLYAWCRFPIDRTVHKTTGVL